MRIWRKGNPFALLVGMQASAATVESSMEIFQKLKNGTAYDPAIPLLGIYPKKSETQNSKESQHLYVHCSTIYNHQDMEAAQCPSSHEWIKQLWDIYTMEYYSAVKKKKILPFVTAWMELENLMLSEISQSEKDKYRMISLICGI